jgi:hypothetical protein
MVACFDFDMPDCRCAGGLHRRAGRRGVALRLLRGSVIGVTSSLSEAQEVKELRRVTDKFGRSLGVRFSTELATSGGMVHLTACTSARGTVGDAGGDTEERLERA